MLSFKSFAVFATLALGAVTSAFGAPLLDNDNANTGVVVARCGCKSVPTIIADVKAGISVNIGALS